MSWERPDQDEPVARPDVEAPRVVRWQELGGLIQARRADEELNLEEAARQSGISAATLSRLERQSRQWAAGRGTSAGPVPDTRTLEKAARWVGVSLGIVEAQRPEVPLQNTAYPEGATTVDVVAAHLRADRHLKPETAEAIARAFRAIYEEFAGMQSGGEVEEPEEQ